jgi:UDPglucose 6-dehydrogenase
MRGNANRRKIYKEKENEMSKKIAIIGMGYVGKAFAKFVGDIYPLVEYDVTDETPYPKDSIDNCDLAVVCVPTPQTADGACDTSIVEEVIKIIETPLIMIKSAVVPGTTDKLKSETGKHIVVSPEYIGESKYHNPIYKTMIDTSFHIVGGDSKDVRGVFEILETIAGPHCVYHSCTAVEAELIKYMENSFLATKVAFVNQFYDIAAVFGADWHKIREGWLLDERIGRSFSQVFANDRGFGGKCLPKDISAIVKATETVGYDASILRAVMEYNKKIRSLNRV